jgi:hypothetical protein
MIQEDHHWVFSTGESADWVTGAMENTNRDARDAQSQMIQGAAGFRASNFCIQTGVFFCVREI